MLGRDLQEWEEYDSRLLDDTPFAPGAPANRRSEAEYQQAPGALEGPFLLANAGEIAGEMERGGRMSRPRPPRARAGRGGMTPPGCNCNCGDSTSDPASVETGEYSESEGLEALDRQESLVEEAIGEAWRA